jgi:CheY-like chemotaxis protein
VITHSPQDSVEDMLNVVAVDDDERIGKVITKVFSADEYNLQCFTSLESALSYLTELPADTRHIETLFILDLQLDDDARGGLALLQELAGWESEYSAVMFSQCSDQELIEECYLAGAKLVLNKKASTKSMA